MQILCRADWAGQNCRTHAAAGGGSDSSAPRPAPLARALPISPSSAALWLFIPTPTAPHGCHSFFRTSSALSAQQPNDESRPSRRQLGSVPRARARSPRGRARSPIKVPARARHRHYPLRSERREAEAAAAHLFPQQPSARRPTPLTPGSR